jgi:bifunctional DNA-binding transcriptional regulator/antitoxin component of YhaV-PrlF toxin-antitoxin module
MSETHQTNVTWRRPVSERGQVVIPIELREALGNPEEIVFVFGGGEITIKGVKNHAPKSIPTETKTNGI